MKKCTEHETPSSGCARCQVDERVRAALDEARAEMIAALRKGWPCLLPGGDIYGPYEDALHMVAGELELRGFPSAAWPTPCNGSE